MRLGMPTVHQYVVIYIHVNVVICPVVIDVLDTAQLSYNRLRTPQFPCSTTYTCTCIHVMLCPVSILIISEYSMLMYISIIHVLHVYCKLKKQ